jgi:hypothetical protein
MKYVEFWGHNMSVSYGEKLLAPSNPQPGGPPLAGCFRVLNIFAARGCLLHPELKLLILRFNWHMTAYKGVLLSAVLILHVLLPKWQISCAQAPLHEGGKMVAAVKLEEFNIGTKWSLSERNMLSVLTENDSGRNTDLVWTRRRPKKFCPCTECDSCRPGCNRWLCWLGHVWSFVCPLFAIRCILSLGKRRHTILVVINTQLIICQKP